MAVTWAVVKAQYVVPITMKRHGEVVQYYWLVQLITLKSTVDKFVC